MSHWESLPFFLQDEVIYLLPVNHIILLCKIGIHDCNQCFIDFTGPFWSRYYQRNPYEYIKYELGNEGEDNDPDDILFNAAGFGILIAIREAVNKGADIRINNNEVVRWAAENGHLEVVKFLVEKGANKINYSCY